MPPFLALTLTGCFVVFSFALERKRNPEVTGALWIPFLWIALIGTRFASEWLNIGSGMRSGPSFEGSPVDQAVFLGLYFAALVVLIRRRVSVMEFIGPNKWIALFLAYCLLSVLWSDYSWTALKRWVKMTEHVAMVLVVLTEPNRTQAIDALFRRFSYFALALSVCFMKYFPDVSRGFDPWTGAAVNMGVTTDKNALGHICVISGLLLSSSLLDKNGARRGSTIWYLDLLMAGFAGWLLLIADAKTALVCFMVGAFLIVLIKKTRFGASSRRIVVFFISSVAVIGLLEAAFNLRDWGIEALGRDATLTDRTLVWADVLAVENNPVVGTGFESFWLGPREEALAAKYWWRPNQAHNGYIETYINLGALGLLFLTAALCAAFANSLRSIATEPLYGPMRFALLIAILLFNYTDATFKAVHILFFVFFLLAIDYSNRDRTVTERASSRASREMLPRQLAPKTHGAVRTTGRTAH